MGLLPFTKWSEKAFLWQQTMKRVLKKDQTSHCTLPKCLFQESRGCKDLGVGHCSERGTERPSQWIPGGRREEMWSFLPTDNRLRNDFSVNTEEWPCLQSQVFRHYTVSLRGGQDSCWVVVSFTCLIKLWLSFEDHKPKWRLYTKACRKQNNQQKQQEKEKWRPEDTCILTNIQNTAKKHKTMKEPSDTAKQSTFSNGSQVHEIAEMPEKDDRVLLVKMFCQGLERLNH